jgi:hypothetical protein
MKQANINNEWIEAAVANRLNTVTELLTKGTDINSVDYNLGNTGTIYTFDHFGNSF